MIEELRNTADELSRDGKLDKKLKRRLRFFEILSFVFGFITIYDILFEGFYWFYVFLVVAASFLFGFFVLSQINRVSWDKRKQMIVATKMDIWGVFILVFYIATRILSDVYLNNIFDGNASKVFAYTFFTIFGVAVGRFVGSLVLIYLAEPSRHRKFRFLKRDK